MDFANWFELLKTLGVGAIGAFGGYFSKAGRIKDKADAYTAMAKSYEYRIESLHKIIDTCNKTIEELQERIASLNRALDDKTDIIRKYVADIMRFTAQLVEAQKEIADLRVALEYALEWRCEHPDCNDPRGRRPPNGKLCSQKFCMPSIVQSYQEKQKATDINIIKPDCHGED